MTRSVRSRYIREIRDSFLCHVRAPTRVACQIVLARFSYLKFHIDDEIESFSKTQPTQCLELFRGQVARNMTFGGWGLKRLISGETGSGLQGYAFWKWKICYWIV